MYCHQNEPAYLLDVTVTKLHVVCKFSGKYIKYGQNKWEHSPVVWKLCKVKTCLSFRTVTVTIMSYANFCGKCMKWCWLLNKNGTNIE